MKSNFTKLMLLSFIFAVPLLSKTIYVKESGNNTADGLSWDQAVSSLQIALDIADYGDDIYIAEGTYYPERKLFDDERSKTFVLKNGVAIYGGFPSEGNPGFNQRDYNQFITTISGDLGIEGYSGDNSYHIFFHKYGDALDNNTILDGLSLRWGNAAGSGIHSNGGIIFNSANSQLRVRNCELRDSYAFNSGAAVYNDEYSEPVFYNCKFMHNYTSGNGIVYNISSNTKFIECEFYNGSAKGSGGAIYNSNSDVSIQNCNFPDNEAPFGGAIYNYGSNPKIINSAFFNNQATTYGGAIYNFESSPKISNCDFTDNFSELGGAISNFFKSSPIVRNCDFVKNFSNKNGGAIRNELYSNARFEYCNFTENRTNANGGAIFTHNHSNPYINHCNFDANLSSKLGNAIYNEYHVKPTVNNSEFKNHVTGFNGSAIANLDSSESIIINSHFFNNRARNTGAAIYNEKSNSTISNCIIENNSSTWYGAGISNLKCKSEINDCIIRNNTSQVGGGVYNEEAPSVFYNNKIIGNIGGGMYNLYSTSEIFNCTFEKNHVTNSRGGGMYNYGSNPIIRNCVFDSNYVKNARGGGLCNYNSNPVIIQTTFKNNYAKYGGGIYSERSSANLYDCLFENNSSEEGGGALANMGYLASPVIQRTKFINNSSAFGGAIYNRGDTCDPVIANSVFYRNQALISGGAIFNRNKTNPEITNCTFSENSAELYAGAIYNRKCEITITNSIIWGNYAEIFANDIYNEEAELTLEYSCYSDAYGSINSNVVNKNSTNENPQFSNKINHPLVLHSSSPCIDGGNNLFILDSQDVRGFARIYLINDTTGTVDIGAYEHQLSFDPGPISIDIPDLISPYNFAKYVEIPTDFEWEYIPEATGYLLQIAKDKYFNNIVSEQQLSATNYTENNLEKTNLYYWRVKAYNSTDTSVWSNVWKFNSVGQRRYVNSIANGMETGATWEDAFTDFQDALDIVGFGDTVYVAEGTYYPSVSHGDDLPRNKSFQMANGVVLIGGFPKTGLPTLKDRDFNKYKTILSGNIGDPKKYGDNTYHVIYHLFDPNKPGNLLLDSTAILDGFVVSDGYANFPNTAHELGGGIYNAYSSPTIRNCIIRDNRARVAGGILNFSSNTKIENCKFINNKADEDGGAVRNNDTRIKLINCYFDSNYAQNGGAVYNIDSYPEIINSIFTNNTVNANSNNSGKGGAVYNILSTTKLINCTFAYNFANKNGGAVYTRYYCKTYIYNSIFWQNKSNNGNDLDEYFEGEHHISHCNISENNIRGKHTIENCIDVDPQFYGKGEHPYVLTAKSYCKDRGDIYIFPKNITTDINGMERIYNNRIDMGACEWNESQDSVLSVNYNNININIYPNPALDYIEISIGSYFDNRRVNPAVENEEIEIYNLLGERVYSTKDTERSRSAEAGNIGSSGYFDVSTTLNDLYAQQPLRIDISHLPSGVYFVKIGERVEKFVKK